MEGATFLPRTIAAAILRSLIRELVQEPMKILSSGISVIGVPGRNCMYDRACCMPRRLAALASCSGSGTHPSMGTTISGEVPQVTMGRTSAPRSVTLRSKVAPGSLVRVRQYSTASSQSPSRGAKGTSLIVIETDKVEGFHRGRNLDKVGMEAQDTSELFFDTVRVPTANLLGPQEGQGFVQLMQQLPQERLTIGVSGVAVMERALDLTIAYVKERKAFGQRLIDFQNTQFKLAECKTEATVARIFIDRLIGLHLEGRLDAATASMAKYWVTDLENKIVDTCLQLFGGYGYMTEYPIARMFRDSRVQRIYGGANEIMKVLIARTL